MPHFLDLPFQTNQYYDNSIDYELHEDMVFVYGSNLAGRHGKGAALAAISLYGAKYGIGIGLVGHSYGIPTKDENIRTLSLEYIKRCIEVFVQDTHLMSDRHFFVTAIGTGLAGYTHADMAPLFRGAQNCWFPLQWKEYLER
jgi:hypothetical protein